MVFNNAGGWDDGGLKNDAKNLYIIDEVFFPVNNL